MEGRGSAALAAAEELSKHKDWMGSMGHLAHQPLNRLSLPGTHDSATYNIYPSPQVSLAPDFPVPLLKKAAPLFNSLVCKVSKCQEFDIATQLRNGIRYFDLRIAPKLEGNREVLWIVHGVYSIRLEEILPQFRDFLEEFKKEIIILDFQHFYNMTPTSHAQLMKLLFTYLGPWLCPNDEFDAQTKVYKFWERDQRVIVIHGSDRNGHGAQDIINMHPVVWSRSFLKSPWHNSLNPNELYVSLTEQLAAKPAQKLFCSQCVLTPRAQTVLSGTSIERLAWTINPLIPKWICSWKELELSPNIVILDFYHTHPEVVDTLVGMNLKLA